MRWAYLVLVAAVATLFVTGDAHAKGDLELSVRLGAGAFVKLVWDAPSLSSPSWAATMLAHSMVAAVS